MRLLAILVAALPLLAQPAKPTASAVDWSYDTPRGFHLIEPAYRFPTPIKQALIQFVQPVPALAKEYQTVCLDKCKFSTWLRSVLLDHRTRQARAAKAEGNVLSSDLSKLSSEGGTVLSTAKARPRKPADTDSVQRYLDVLKVWDPN